MDTRKKLWIVDGVLAVILVIICVGGYFVLHPMPSEIPLPNVITAEDGAVTVTADAPRENQAPEIPLRGRLATLHCRKQLL